MAYFNQKCERCGAPIREVGEFIWVDEEGLEDCEEVHVHSPENVPAKTRSVWLIELPNGTLSQRMWEDERLRDFVNLPEGARWVEFVEVPFLTGCVRCGQPVPEPGMVRCAPCSAREEGIDA